MIDLKHLKLVRSVALCGSLARAADELDLTPSALSHRLRTLEEQLGTPLFLRAGRGLALNEAGRRMLAAAEEILDLVGRAEDRVRALGSGAAAFRVGSECFTAFHWLPPIASSLRDLGVSISIAANSPRRCTAALLAGEIDLAVSPVAMHDSRLETEELFADELVAAVASSHRLADRPFLEPADFEKEVVLPHTCDDLILKNFLHKAGVQPPEVSTVALTEGNCALARAGFGVGVLSRWALQPNLGGGLVAVRMGREGLWRRWRAVYLSGRTRAPAFAEFVGILRSCEITASGPRIAAPNAERISANR